MNRIVTFAVVGFLTLASDSEAQAQRVPTVLATENEYIVPKLRDDGANLFGSDRERLPNSKRFGATSEMPFTNGQGFFSDDGTASQRPFSAPSDDGTASERLFSDPSRPKLTNRSFDGVLTQDSIVRLDPQLRDLVAKQTQLITSLSSSIQELQRTVEEIRTSSQDETTQLKKQLTLTDTRLKTLETKTGGN